MKAIRRNRKVAQESKALARKKKGQTRAVVREARNFEQIAQFSRTGLARAKRRRLAEGIREKIRHYQRCLRMVPGIDSEVLAAGMELFTSESALGEWLSSPAPALGCKIPIFTLRTKKGRTSVVQILRALAHGMCI